MLSPSNTDIQIPKPIRAPWRQRLVDAETGFRIGLRSDSTLFVYLFVGATLILSGFVFGLSRIEWALLSISMGLTLCVELFHQLLLSLIREFKHHLPNDLNKTLRLGTAAVVATNVMTLVVAAILFGGRVFDLIKF